MYGKVFTKSEMFAEVDFSLFARTFPNKCFPVEGFDGAVNNFFKVLT